MPLFKLPHVQLQMKLTTDPLSFYLMNKNADSNITFTFLDAYLILRRVQPNTLIWSANTIALTTGAFARYDIRIFDLNISTFSSGSKSQSSDNAVLGPIPKRLLFTMIKKADVNNSLDTTPLQI